MRSLALWRAAGLAVLLAVVAVIPLDNNVVLTQVGVLVLLYVGAAVGWNIFSGFTGYISLGAAVFFGTGVYTVALITKHLKKGERIRIVGLGILQVRKRAARMGRNPATGEAIHIKASKKVAFRAAKELKEAV